MSILLCAPAVVAAASPKGMLPFDQVAARSVRRRSVCGRTWRDAAADGRPGRPWSSSRPTPVSGIAPPIAGRPDMADGAYRSNPAVVMRTENPPAAATYLDGDHTEQSHCAVRAQAEHALASMKSFKILHDYRRLPSNVQWHCVNMLDALIQPANGNTWISPLPDPHWPPDRQAPISCVLAKAAPCKMRLIILKWLVRCPWTFTGSDRSGGLGPGAAPAVLAFAADPGSFAALRGQDVRVAGVGVAPTQIFLQLAGQDGVVGVVRVGHGEHPQRPELRFDRVGPGRAGRREAQLDPVAGGPASPSQWGIRSSSPVRERCTWPARMWVSKSYP